MVGRRDDHQSPQLREFLMKNEQQAARRQSPDPAPLPQDATENLSGLDQVRGMRDGTFGIAPMQALMNMRLFEAEEGLVVFTAVPEEKHYNPQGTVHGAFATAILDSAMGLAVVTKLPRYWSDHSGIQAQLHPTDVSADRGGSGRGARDPLRSVDRDSRRASVRARWQADRPRDRDVHDFQRRRAD